MNISETQKRINARHAKMWKRENELTKEIAAKKYEVYSYYTNKRISYHRSWVEARDALKKIQWPATMYAIRERHA